MNGAMNGLNSFPPPFHGARPGFAGLVPSTPPSFTNARNTYTKILLGLQAQVGRFTKAALAVLPFENSLGEHARAWQVSLGKMEMGLSESILALRGPEKVKKIAPEVIKSINEKFDKLLKDLKEIENPKQVKAQEDAEAVEPGFNPLKKELEKINNEKSKIAETVAADSAKLKAKIDLFGANPRSESSEQGTALRLKNYIPEDFFAEIMEGADKKEKARGEHYIGLKNEWNQAELKQFESVVLADRLEIALSIMPDVAALASIITKRHQEILGFKSALEALDIKSFSAGFVPEKDKRDLTDYFGIVQNKKEILAKFSEILPVITALEKAKTELFERIQAILEKTKESFEEEYADQLNGKITFIEPDRTIEKALEDLSQQDIDKRKEFALQLIKEWNDLTLQFHELKGYLSLVSLFKDLKITHCELYLAFEEMAGDLRYTRKKKEKREEHQEDFTAQLKKFNELSKIVSSNELYEKKLNATFTEIPSSTSEDLKSDELTSAQFLWLEEKDKKGIEVAFDKQKSFFSTEEETNEDMISESGEKILPNICDHAVEELNFMQTTLRATSDEKGEVSKTCSADFRKEYTTKAVFRSMGRVADFANGMVTAANSLVKYTGVPVRDNGENRLDDRIESPFTLKGLDK